MARIIQVLDKSNDKKPEHAKITNNVRNYGEQPQTANKDSVNIVGDLLIKRDNGRGISRSHRVQIGPNPGTSTYDLIDYVKPALRKKPKALLIHTSTDDIQQEINTVKTFKKWVKEMKEKDSENETEIIFSRLIQREDYDFRDQMGKSTVNLKNTASLKVINLLRTQTQTDAC